MTARNELIGTPTYMAPERLDGYPYDGHSDVYSVGIMLYEMFAAQVTFADRNQSYFKVMFNHLHGHYDLAPRRRARPGYAQTRLVAVTGYRQESDRRRALEAGFDAHLVKPVQRDALEALVRAEQSTPT